MLISLKSPYSNILYRKNLSNEAASCRCSPLGAALHAFYSRGGRSAACIRQNTTRTAPPVSTGIPVLYGILSRFQPFWYTCIIVYFLFEIQTYKIRCSYSIRPAFVSAGRSLRYIKTSPTRSLNIRRPRRLSSLREKRQSPAEPLFS